MSQTPISWALAESSSNICCFYFYEVHKKEEYWTNTNKKEIKVSQCMFTHTFKWAGKSFKTGILNMFKGLWKYDYD